MQLFSLLLIFGVALTSGQSQVEVPKVPQIPQHLVEFGSQLVAKLLTWGIISQLQNGRYQFYRKDGPIGKAPIVIPIPFPELPDPINLLPLNIPFDHVNDADDTALKGFFNIIDPKIRGLSQLDDSLLVGFDFVTKNATLDMSLALPSITATSNYVTDIFMNYTWGNGVEDMVISGNGPFVAGFDGFLLDFSATIYVPLTTGNRLRLPELDFDFSFENVIFTMDNLLINGEPVQLDNIGELLKSVYDLIWVPSRPTLVNMIRLIVDDMINDCPPLDLVAGIYDCLKGPRWPVPPEPELPTDPPTSPPAPTSPVTQGPTSGTQGPTGSTGSSDSTEDTTQASGFKNNAFTPLLALVASAVYYMF